MVISVNGLPCLQSGPRPRGRDRGEKEEHRCMFYEVQEGKEGRQEVIHVHVKEMDSCSSDTCHKS